MISVDEYKFGRLSQMVSRVRNQEGDPRFFLADIRQSSKKSE